MIKPLTEDSNQLLKNLYNEMSNLSEKEFKASWKDGLEYVELVSLI